MKSLRVLIADDDGLTLMVVRKILMAMGHSVVGEAGDGEQAVALARETHPDLIIFDIRMPKMDGLEAARLVQSQRPTPIIILSAHTESGLGSEAAGVGANAYLVKPFTGEQLKPAIELALANFEKSKELEAKIQQMNGKRWNRAKIVKSAPKAFSCGKRALTRKPHTSNCKRPPAMRIESLLKWPAPSFWPSKFAGIARSRSDHTGA